MTVRYGAEPDHVADVWLPARPGPLVLCWHGGWWRQAYDRRHLAALAADLAGHGYVVATPEYRRTGGAGGWPATLEDAAAAADAIPALLAGRISPAAPCYLGHSAGGQLAMWAALRHRLPPGAPGRRDQTPAVRGVLALAAVSDVAEAYRRDLDLGAARALLGGGPARYPDRYAVASPAALPVPDAPTVLVHGKGDGRVPVVMSREYAADRDVRLVEVDGADHFALIDPASPAWPIVLTELSRLLRP